MDLTGYRFQSEFVRKHFGEGRAKGLAEGKAEGKAEAVLAVLAARQVPVSAKQRARVLASTDLDQLDRWLLRAATAESVRDVFGADPVARRPSAQSTKERQSARSSRSRTRPRS